MGESFEILNILVEVLVQGKGHGSMGPSHQYFKNTPKPFEMFSVTHLKARPTKYVIFLPEIVSDSPPPR